MQKKEFALWKENVYEPQIVLYDANNNNIFLLIKIHMLFCMQYICKLFLSSRHAQLMHEKAEIERKEMEAQMLIFMMNRSARILQK